MTSGPPAAVKEGRTVDVIPMESEASDERITSLVGDRGTAAPPLQLGRGAVPAGRFRSDIPNDRMPR